MNGHSDEESVRNSSGESSLLNQLADSFGQRIIKKTAFCGLYGNFLLGGEKYKLLPQAKKNYKTFNKHEFTRDKPDYFV